MGAQGEGADGGVVGQLDADAPGVSLLGGAQQMVTAVGIVDDSRCVDVGQEALAQFEAHDGEVTLHKFVAYNACKRHLLAQVAMGEVSTHGVGVYEWDVLAHEVTHIQSGE